MCKSYYLVNEERLGKRTEGYILYTPESKEFIGMTVKAIKEQMEAGGKVYGCKIAADGHLELDKSGFHCENIMVKSGVGSLRPLNDGGECVMTVMFVLVGVDYDESGKAVYEVVNSRYARTTITEERLRLLIEMHAMSGAYINESKEVVICEGVEVRGKPCSPTAKPEGKQVGKK